MNGPFGFSFAPTQDQAEDAGRRASLEGVPQAIKMMSLRLPQILGARAPVAAELLKGQGMAGLGEGAQALFQSLINQLGAPNAMGRGVPNPPPVGARPNPGRRPPLYPPVGETGGGFPPPPRGPRDSGGPVMPSGGYSTRVQVQEDPAFTRRVSVRGGFGA